MIRLIWAETRKLGRTASIQITTILCLLFAIWAYATTRRMIAHGEWHASLVNPNFSFTYASASLAAIGSLACPFIGAVSAGMEFGYKTWPALLTHGARRWQVWLVKLCSVAGVVAVWVVGTLIFGYLCSIWASGKFALRMVNARVLAQIGVLFWFLLFWVVFAFTFAVAFRGTSAGVVMGIVFQYVNMLLEVPGKSLKLWLPIWNQRAIITAAFGTDWSGIAAFDANPEFPPVWQALTVVTVMFAVLVVASYYLTNRLRTD